MRNTEIVLRLQHDSVIPTQVNGHTIECFASPEVAHLKCLKAKMVGLRLRHRRNETSCIRARPVPQLLKIYLFLFSSDLRSSWTRDTSKVVRAQCIGKFDRSIERDTGVDLAVDSRRRRILTRACPAQPSRPLKSESRLHREDLLGLCNRIPQGLQPRIGFPRFRETVHKARRCLRQDLQCVSHIAHFAQFPRCRRASHRQPSSRADIRLGSDRIIFFKFWPSEYHDVFSQVRSEGTGNARCLVWYASEPRKNKAGGRVQ